MKEREFRELQVSSTQLAIIFLAIIVLGIVIFLLGVSVGKKHAQEALKASSVAQKEPELAREKIVLPPVQTAPAGPAETRPQAQPQTKKEERELPKLKTSDKAAAQVPSPSPGENLYYVQVGALTERPAALSLAQQFKEQGYPVIVLDPLATDKTPYYRVRIGGFATRAEAEAVKTKLAGGPGRKIDSFIVKD